MSCVTRCSRCDSRARRVHWREERPTRRRRLAAAVASLDVRHIAVVATDADPGKQERARRQCLKRLLWELDHGLDVARLTLESRRERDRHDIAAVTGFRRAHLISSVLRIDHALPAQEPLLWFPDIVAGAVSASRAGAIDYLNLLAAKVTTHDISVG